MAEATPGLVPGPTASEERLCPRCQAQNSLTAAFCWQCYAPFVPGRTASATGVAAPGGADTGWAPGPWPRQVPPVHQPPGLPYPQRARPGAGLKLGAVLLSALVAAAAGWLVTGKLFRTHVVLPVSVAGYTKVTSPQIEQGIDQFHDLLDRLDVEGDLAFYGTSGAPQVALIWFEDPGSTDAESAFRSFASGFNTSGSTLDVDAMETKAVRGAEYLCAPVSGSLRAAMCMWEGDGVYWFLLDTQPGLGFSKTRDLSVRARNVVQA